MESLLFAVQEVQIGEMFPSPLGEVVMERKKQEVIPYRLNK